MCIGWQHKCRFLQPRQASPMNRRILAIPFAIVLVAIIGASLAPLFLTPPVPQCAHLSTPVRFNKIDSRPVQVRRGTRQFTAQFPVVEYSYVVSGTSYTSTRIFAHPATVSKRIGSRSTAFFTLPKMEANWWRGFHRHHPSRRASPSMRSLTTPWCPVPRLNAGPSEACLGWWCKRRLLLN